MNNRAAAKTTAGRAAVSLELENSTTKLVGEASEPTTNASHATYPAHHGLGGTLNACDDVFLASGARGPRDAAASRSAAQRLAPLGGRFTAMHKVLNFSFSRAGKSRLASHLMHVMKCVLTSSLRNRAWFH